MSCWSLLSLSLLRCLVDHYCHYHYCDVLLIIIVIVVISTKIINKQSSSTYTAGVWDVCNNRHNNNRTFGCLLLVWCSFNCWVVFLPLWSYGSILTITTAMTKTTTSATTRTTTTRTTSVDTMTTTTTRVTTITTASNNSWPRFSNSQDSPTANSRQ